MSGQLWCPGGGRPELGLSLVSSSMEEVGSEVEVEEASGVEVVDTFLLEEKDFKVAEVREWEVTEVRVLDSTMEGLEDKVGLQEVVSSLVEEFLQAIEGEVVVEERVVEERVEEDSDLEVGVSAGLQEVDSPMVEGERGVKVEVEDCQDLPCQEQTLSPGPTLFVL